MIDEIRAIRSNFFVFWDDNFFADKEFAKSLLRIMATLIKRKWAAQATVKDCTTNNIWGYEFDKIIRTQEELDAFNVNNPDYRFGSCFPALGMMVYQDLSSPNGVPDGIIDSFHGTR